MANGKMNIRSKVQASTIMEVVVSMVIIILVFGIAMIMYTNVMRMSLSAQKVHAQALLQHTLTEAEKAKSQVSRSITVDDLRIEQEIKPFSQDTILTEIHLTAYDANQQKIAELQKVILNK